ncbi:hypothetical protein SERLADRAFT_469886 [Serpula lacrymans var. lacrymans S7.9]|uniref:Mid2 domain-containing protein n=1 Tax=Serpula lacrymans var. lacrymans (strain S7.9) TaxID=578457 RepID=F8NYL7_SERL9|nr:uncharacterized protein SERLADRAFT_469886 [Serpula lacrymans var. lacrymans S7.9]EGO23688.1 hypothetical protein SERLADRAFT_469886 [Serpula lacrymans var. lacrymans S7.9]
MTSTHISSSTSPTQTSNSIYNYLTTVSSLEINNSPTTTRTQSTLTNPDQATTTLTAGSIAPSSAPSIAPLPSNLPRIILPPGQQYNQSTVPAGYSLISVLFNQSLNWQWVAQNADTSGQIFEYFPQVIATALGIDASQIYNYELEVYIPSSYQGTQDVAQLGTEWLGFISSALVQQLASLVSNEKSPFYTAQVGSIPQTLASCVDPSLPIDSVSSPTTGSGSSTSSNGNSSSNSSKVRQDAIIGVVSSLGAIALIVLGYIAYKSIKKRRELAHRRLSDPGFEGARPDGQEFDRDSVGGQRRRSFYYAEDSLRGYQGVRTDGDDYDNHVTGVRERRTLVPGAPISNPILRESSLNW